VVVVFEGGVTFLTATGGRSDPLLRPDRISEVLIGRAAVLVFGRGACAKCEASFLSPAAEVDLATRTTGFRSTEVALTALPARLIFLLMPGEDPL